MPTQLVAPQLQSAAQQILIALAGEADAVARLGLSAGAVIDYAKQQCASDPFAQATSNGQPNAATALFPTGAVTGSGALGAHANTLVTTIADKVKALGISFATASNAVDALTAEKVVALRDLVALRAQLDAANARITQLTNVPVTGGTPQVPATTPTPAQPAAQTNPIAWAIAALAAGGVVGPFDLP